MDNMDDHPSSSIGLEGRWNSFGLFKGGSFLAHVWPPTGGGSVALSDCLTSGGSNGRLNGTRPARVGELGSLAHNYRS